MEQLKNVVVIGAGVIGLTTALNIQEKGGYAVTIVAEILPSDPKTIKYTSLWAGAHHVSHAENDPRQFKLDSDTFKVMWELSAPGGAAEACFLRLPQIEYYGQKSEFDPHHLSWMPDFKILPESSLVPNTLSGVSFSTLTIDTPVYLNYLLSRFLSKGGAIVRGAVQDIAQVVEGGASIFTGSKVPTPPDAVIVCSGLGARFLVGIEDKDCYPIRGQILLIRAPWIRFGRTISTKEGLWTYIIPRRSGDVIVGGTKIDNDWYPNPRPETSEDVLERAFALCPELAPPEIRAQRAPTIDDVRSIIISEGCGLRPGRKGGIRLDVRWTENNGKKVPLVSNYGHGGQGFQSSWGSAFTATELLENALKDINVEVY